MNVELRIDGIVLDCADNAKVLSVIINNKLNWNNHINYISRGGCGPHRVTPCQGLTHK